MDSIGPQIPGHLLAGGIAGRRQESAVATEQPETAAPAAAGPSTVIPTQTSPLPSTTIIPPTLRVPRYEEEEEDEEDEDEDDGYAPELPPELAAARANPSGAPPQPPRRTMGPAWGPLRREEEEEESEEEEEVGPPPPPPPGAGSSLAAREDAVTEFMQKEAQRRQAVEVRRRHPLDSGSSFLCACTCVELYSSPPLLHRRQRDQRRFSVKSGCSSRLRLRTC
jgi:hypothetical protein